MDKNFWHQKWDKNDIGFHEGKANPLLVKYFNKLSLDKGSRVFLPLCGKTLDLHWLLANGYRVAGAELCQAPIEQLFAELRMKPKISGAGKVDRYSAKNIDIFVGDIFDLSTMSLGQVEAIYDRAALVALPEEMRGRYTAHIASITNKAPQLLLCCAYDQSAMAGPPFSISNEEVKERYGASYDLTLLESEDVPGGLKGKCAARENVWLLNPLN